MMVATTAAVNGEIEQTISTSGTVITEKTKSYFSEVNVKIGDVPVRGGGCSSGRRCADCI